MLIRLYWSTLLVSIWNVLILRFAEKLQIFDSRLHTTIRECVVRQSMYIKTIEYALNARLFHETITMIVQRNRKPCRRFQSTDHVSHNKSRVDKCAQSLMLTRMITELDKLISESQLIPPTMPTGESKRTEGEHEECGTLSKKNSMKLIIVCWILQIVFVERPCMHPVRTPFESDRPVSFAESHKKWLNQLINNAHNANKIKRKLNPQLIPTMAAETRIITTKYHIFFRTCESIRPGFRLFFSNYFQLIVIDVEKRTRIQSDEWVRVSDQTSAEQLLLWPE